MKKGLLYWEVIGACEVIDAPRGVICFFSGPDKFSPVRQPLTLLERTHTRPHGGEFWSECLSSAPDWPINILNSFFQGLEWVFAWCG